jgi:AcrR family transcriptional regulator
MSPTESRERLLAAARDVVAAQGLEGLTLRAIARKAGVSHGAPLRHFPSLAALLSAVAAEGFDRLVATVDGHLADADAAAAGRGEVLTPLERIRVAGRGYVSFARNDPGVFSITFRPERVDVNDAAYQEAGYRSFHQLVELVEVAQADGWRPADDATELSAVLWSHVHGVAELALHGGLEGVVGEGALARVLDLSADLALGPTVSSSLGPIPQEVLS